MATRRITVGYEMHMGKSGKTPVIDAARQRQFAADRSIGKRLRGTCSARTQIALLRTVTMQRRNCSVAAATQTWLRKQSWQSEWRRNWDRTRFRSGLSEFGNRSSPLFRNETMVRIEAILFVAREPLTSRKIAQLGNLSDGTQARTVIRQLNKLYDVAGCAFRVEEVAGGYQLFTRPMFGPWLRRLLQTTLEIRLSAPALETLAVVAYRQPILRAEVEAIRGVQCGDLLRQLLDRDLIRISGRAEDLGRPLVYGTTKQFLQMFGLRHLDELPRAAQLRRTQAAASDAAASEKGTVEQSKTKKSSGAERTAGSTKSRSSTKSNSLSESNSPEKSNSAEKKLPSSDGESQTNLPNIPDINHIRFHEEELC